MSDFEAKTPQLRRWELEVRRTLSEAQSLQRFCKERFQYSRYEDGLADLIQNLEMDVITAATS